MTHACAVAVIWHPLPSPKDVHVLDGSSLSTHLSLLVGVFALQGVGCTQQDLERSAHCVAEVLLQMVPRLVEVRAAAQGYSSAAELAGMERVASCCPSQHTHLWSALLSLTCARQPELQHLPLPA